MKIPFTEVLRRHVLLLHAVFLLALSGLAQRPAHYEHPNADLAHALELFSKAKYGPARFELDRVVDRIADPNDMARVEAEFYTALCAVRLFNDDAGYRLNTFIAQHPESQFVPEVRLELFRHAFAMKKWKDAIAWSEKLDRFSLSQEEQEEYRFKRGYAYFQQDDRDRALGEFAEVKDLPAGEAGKLGSLGIPPPCWIRRWWRRSQRGGCDAQPAELPPGNHAANQSVHPPQLCLVQAIPLFSFLSCLPRR